MSRSLLLWSAMLLASPCVRVQDAAPDAAALSSRLLDHPDAWIQARRARH